MNHLCRVPHLSLQLVVILAFTVHAFTAVTPASGEKAPPSDPNERVTLNGTVRDTSDNILPNVSVHVLSEQTTTNHSASDRSDAASTQTDRDGEFFLTVHASTPIRLRLTKEGYNEKLLTITDTDAPVETAMVAKTDDTGLIQHTAQISMSHCLGAIRRDRERYQGRPMDESLYREIVERFGEEPHDEAIFRIYLPPETPKLNGLFLISEHGVGGPMMESPLVRKFADRHRLALVGVLGDVIQRGIYPASALDSVLAQIAQRTQHPEMTTVPVFTFGHSNGTGFSASYAAMRPDRVIGWVSFHSGGSWHLIFPGVEKVPGLIMHGDQDSYFDQGQMSAVKDLRRQRNAPVALLVDGESGHWPRDRDATFSLVTKFCESCLRLRFSGWQRNAEQLAWPDEDLQTPAIDSGWLGEHYDREQGGMQTLAIFPYSQFPGERSTANWLPDETFAQAWQNYAATGKP
ncbi:carboxypeptidase-like regulatory domain-containing protein [Rhodopirellula sallentina]|nr:carboxypeptidase-like regulatory domain-containing protein [Rhodopirellula sallentina]